MQWPWNISDADFVSRAERFQSHRRRPIAIFMVLLSAISIGFGFYIVFSFEVESFPVEITQSSFIIGVIYAYFAGKFVAFGLLGLFSGFHCWFARRKDQLLVAYHRRLLELGELDVGGQQ